MIVHHLSAASLCPRGAKLISGSGGLLQRGHMVCHCWLVETPRGLLLVDTGLGRDDLADPQGRLGGLFTQVVAPQLGAHHTAWAQLQALGYEPRDVRHIVPTHLDLDHAGGLPDFPDADVHVFRPEYEAALSPRTRLEKNRYRPAHFAHGPRWQVREAQGESWFGFRGVRAMDETDEVLLIPLLGHTRGHCGVAVKTRSGWLLHAGDAYFSHREVAQPPRCPPGLAAFQRVMAVDNGQRLHNQERLRVLAREHGSEVSIHCAHCPVEFERFVSRAPASEGRGTVTG